MWALSSAFNSADRRYPVPSVHIDSHNSNALWKCLSSIDGPNGLCRRDGARTSQGAGIESFPYTSTLFIGACHQCRDRWRRSISICSLGVRLVALKWREWSTDAVKLKRLIVTAKAVQNGAEVAPLRFDIMSQAGDCDTANDIATTSRSWLVAKGKIIITQLKWTWSTLNKMLHYAGGLRWGDTRTCAWFAVKSS